MALLETFTPKNLVLSRGLAIRYNTRRDGASYVLTRYASKEYSYVGLSLEAAKRCCEAKRAQYTRDVYSVSSTSYQDRVDRRLMADVTIRRAGGDTYRVDISVNETDARRVSREYEQVNIDPEKVFRFECLRQYDEVYPISVYNVYRRSDSKVVFEAGYLSPDVIPDIMTAQYQNLNAVTYLGADWTNINCELDAVGNILVSIAPTGSPRAFRFTAGGFDSNVVVLPAYV